MMIFLVVTVVILLLVDIVGNIFNAKNYECIFILYNIYKISYLKTLNFWILLKHLKIF